jgi:hypothetical protein
MGTVLLLPGEARTSNFLSSTAVGGGSAGSTSSTATEVREPAAAPIPELRRSSRSGGKGAAEGRMFFGRRRGSGSRAGSAGGVGGHAWPLAACRVRCRPLLRSAPDIDFRWWMDKGQGGSTTWRAFGGYRRRGGGGIRRRRTGGAAGRLWLRCGLGEDAVRVHNPNRSLLYAAGWAIWPTGRRWAKQTRRPASESG